MSEGDDVQVKFCEIRDPPHPCDPPPYCDPYKEEEGDCPKPYICYERLKNPAMGITRCLPGPFINAKYCDWGPQEPWDPSQGRGVVGPTSTSHPCDPLPPCSTKRKKRPCREPVLCYHRIKNPEWPRKPITSDCDPTLD